MHGGAMQPRKRKIRSLMELPDSLIYEIRVRLPAKSLVRFRCVARTWNNITQDPYMAHKQLMQLNPPTTLLCFTIFNSELARSVAVPAANFSFYGIQMWVSEDYSFSSACNGWICFGARDPYNRRRRKACPLLYNPLLQQTWVPPLTLNNVIKASSYKHYGLGFDPNTHLFKLFAIANTISKLDFFKFTHNSWIPMDPVGAAVYGSVASNGSSVFLNGVVHFHLDLENPKRQVIVAFEAHKEELRLMAFPEAIPPNRLCFLSKLGGLLAIFEYPDHSLRDSFNIHMQLDLGGGEWNVHHKLTSRQVGCRFGVTSCNVRLYPPATCDDKVIIRWDDEVIAYDISTRKMRMLWMPRRFNLNTNKLLHSLELSLVPLNGLVES